MKRFSFGRHENEEKKDMGLVPFRRLEIDGLLDNFFSDVFNDFGAFGVFAPLKAFKGPAIDVYEKDNSVIVRADLPGMKKEDIRLQLDGDILTISGETNREKEQRKKGYYYTERSFGRIQRSIRLPEGTQKEKIKASYKDGVLSVEIPTVKTADDKARDIEIE